PGGTIAQPAAPTVATPGVATPTAPAVPAVNPPAPELKAGQMTKDCNDCPEVIGVPAGKFVMGSPQNEAGRNAAEGPQTKVSIGAFAMGRYPITRGEFAAFVADTYYE